MLQKRSYKDFLQSKQIRSVAVGFESSNRNPKLFNWQSDIVNWSLKKGKARYLQIAALEKQPCSSNGRVRFASIQERMC